MTEAPELEELHYRGAVRAGIPVRPVVLHTAWEVGPVAAFLFPSDPVTLVDSGSDDELSRAELESVFASTGRRPEELQRIIVTHGHSDHLGGARWLQEVSGCEVLLHRDDVPRVHEWRGDRRRTMMHALGFGEESMQRFFGRWATGRGRNHAERRYPEVTELQGGETFDAGGRRLRVEHHPGHSPGHVWVVDEQSGAIFAGDYLLANSPTNAGLELEAGDPSRRRPMLALYHEGLAAMARLEVPVVFPAHGPPITDHRELIRKRLEKSGKRTQHVLRVLRRTGEASPFDVTYGMYGERIARNAFDIIADVVGRLDLLADEGRAKGWVGEDGVWRFAPAST